ncbi:MAG: murein biosynthesis integral membrane protein MurJ [Pseudomonadota bacterium]
MTLISRVLGFFREVLTAARLGAGPVADTFFQAFMIPNTFRRIFAEGAFNAAFVPLYAREMEGAGHEEADRFMSEALSFLITVTGAIVVAFQLAAPWLAYVFVPGRIGDPDGMALAVLLIQITMPYLLCMAVVALISGGLNTHGRFATAAAAPVLLNVFMIAVLAADIWTGRSLAIALSISVTASGVAQLVMLVMAARSARLGLRLMPPRITPRVKRLILLGIPGAVAAGATQINVLLTSSIATLEAGARSWLNYAERLYQLPLGVIGIAMGVALLPNLARRLRAGDEAGGQFALNRSLEISAALTLPAAAAFLVIPGFLVSGLYEWDQFTAADSRATAQALTAYAAGLPAFVMIKVLTPGFFAREDTQTPMRYALASMAINLVLALSLFFGGMGFVGLAIASSVAGWVNAVLLATTLTERGYLKIDTRFASRLPRLVIASAAMAAAVWLAAAAGPSLTSAIAAHIGPNTARVLVLLLVVSTGALVYALACLASGALKPREFLDALRPGRDARPDPSAGDLS